MRGSKKKRNHILLVFVLLMLLGGILFWAKGEMCFWSGVQVMKGKKTVAERLEQYGQAAGERWKPYFTAAGLDYPPKKVLLVGIKSQKKLEVWGADGEDFRFLREYPILAASGRLGPKRRAGDNQVPEGIYQVESLNPNSRFHLALRLNYPNPYDQEMAKRDGREDLGGDIMIHGSNCSIGCLAMGDEAAEDLFVLAAETGIEKVSVLLTPVDFRKEKLPELDDPLPEWVGELYSRIREEMP